MKKLILSTLVIFLASVFSITQAQSLDDVLAKHFKATGQEKLADVNTYIIKAKLSMMGQEMPMTLYTKKPNKFKTEMEMMGQKIITSFDGENGYMLNPMVGTEPKKLEGAELDQAMSQANMMEGELYNYKEKGSEAELIGKVMQNDKEVYRVKLTDKSGLTKNIFIDANTYLISSVKATIEQMGQSIDIESKMLEYMDVQGIKMARKIEVVTPMGSQNIIMEEVKLNEEIDDSVFKSLAK